jgi:hypothetical protein
MTHSMPPPRDPQRGQADQAGWVWLRNIGNYRRRILSHIAITRPQVNITNGPNRSSSKSLLTCTAQSQLDSPRMDTPHYA